MGTRNAPTQTGTRAGLQPGAGSFMYKKPNPKHAKEMKEARERDQAAYDRWAAQRPTGGSSESGGTLTKEQSRKILAISRSRSFKKHGKMSEEELREHVIKPKEPEPEEDRPLTKEELREKRLKALGVL